MLTRDAELRPAEQATKRLTLAVLADPRFVTVCEDTPLLDVMTRMRAAGASVAVVTNGTGKTSAAGVRGLITKQQIANAVIDGMELHTA